MINEIEYLLLFSLTQSNTLIWSTYSKLTEYFLQKKYLEE
ncbi:MAG: hypothetical protein A4E25_00615 [Methanobacterium sp. PtaB.Bin024]|nr:MAG: hypothetical protein A4E25_00615 [Methanobacterium sp. PtaB.Bin024]